MFPYLHLLEMWGKRPMRPMKKIVELLPDVLQGVLDQGWKLAIIGSAYGHPHLKPQFAQLHMLCIPQSFSSKAQNLAKAPKIGL